MPLSISYALNDLQNDEDFAFDEFPMPYDVKITYDPKNSDPKAKYRLVPVPNKEPVTDEEKALLDEAMKKQTPEQFVEMKKKYQSGSVSQRKEELPDDINPDDIPF